MHLKHSATQLGFLHLAFLVLTGCLDPQGRIAVDADKNPEAMFLSHSTRFVVERFMLLPVGLENTKEASVFGSGSLKLSAWWDMTFGGSSPFHTAVGLHVIDLETKQHHQVFDRRVAIGSWELSFSDHSGDVLQFDNVLLIPARTDDIDGDGFITHNDPVWLYLYHLKDHKLTRISPQGYHVHMIHKVSNRIVMTMKDERERTTITIYTYDPSKRAGDFVARNLAP